MTLPPFDWVSLATPGGGGGGGAGGALPRLMADAQRHRFLSAKAFVGRFPLTLKLGKLKLEMGKKKWKKLSKRENIYSSKDFTTARGDISAYGGTEGMETVFFALVCVFFFLLTFQTYCLSFAKSADGRILAVRVFSKRLELDELGPAG